MNQRLNDKRDLLLATAPNKRRLSFALVVFASLLGCANANFGQPTTSLSSALLPESSRDLHIIEHKSRAVAERAIEATVGVRVGGNLGSGVIVSEDGYVITAGHVIETPGQVVEITLTGGRKLKGRTLGVNRWIDSGLIKIDGEGPWPFMEMGTATSLEPGEWVMAIGHPGGYEKDRPPVVRLGRVTTVDAQVIRTDCTIVSGDSGGPLFDLDGKVVGIHTSLRPMLVANDHLPVDTFIRTWDRLKAGKGWGGIVGGRALLGVRGRTVDGACQVEIVLEGFAADLAGLRVGDVITGLGGDDLSGGFAELEQRISEFSAGEPVQLEVDRNEKRIEFEVKLSRYERGEPVRIVRSSQSSRGRTKNDFELLNSFRASVSEISQSVASIVCDGRRVALGAVVSVDGRIVTKASELNGKIICWIDGVDYEAKLIGVDSASDIAVLEIDAEGLEPLVFADAGLPAETVSMGQWVITPDTSGTPISVGVASTPARSVEGRTGYLGISMRNVNNEVRIDLVMGGSSAAAAGLVSGDILTKVNGMNLISTTTLQRILRSLRPHSEVELGYKRAGKEFLVRVPLGWNPSEARNPVEQQNRQAGPTSNVRSGFPHAFQHDSVLAPNQCGGPIVDLDGRLLGLNLARAGRTVSYAIPSSKLELVIADIERNAQRHSAEPVRVMR
ncbi:MAG: serine protease Do [Planctomycetota bacterium]|jgi:serine protease Do